MAKLLRRLVIMVLAASLVLTTVAFYYRLQVQQAVDSAVAQVASLVVVDYGSLSGDVDGAIELQDVVLTPAGSQARLNVERIVLQTSGWQYLLQAGEQLDQGVWPAQIRVELQGLRLQLNPANSQLVDRFLTRVVPQSETVALLAMACGGHKPLSFQQLHEMGVTQLRGGLTFNYQYDSETGAVDASVSLNPEQMFALGFDLQGMMPATQLTTALLDSFPLRLKQLQIGYRDTGYHRLRNGYCAGLDDDLVSQYMKIHGLRLSENLKQQGWAVPLRVATDYQVMMADGGGFELSLMPGDPLSLDVRGWQALQEMLPQGVLQRLNPILTVNRRSVDLQAMLPVVRDQSSEVVALLQQTEDHAPGAGVSAQEALQDGAQALSPEQIRRQQTQALLRDAMKATDQDDLAVKSYKSVSVDEVIKHVGRSIRLQTYYGRQVEGTLQRVEGKMLYVTQHLQQGSAVYPIDKTKLSELEVLH
ncbi:hypothetical protein [Amphritea sp. HPY]|uniref:hypothetical protein n=1 Tax=Amphritea sp. HPY TaxID=3421652 RepID=UPI003D7D3320